MLDEHYGMVMIFSTLMKELYFLKQGSGENVDDFGVHLLKQVQILQSEYPGRIQQQHIEEMKWDHFYEGLSPKYQDMLVHKVHGKHPTNYSDLLFAAEKLEKQAEARDFMLTKTTMTEGSNVTWPQTSVNFLEGSWRAIVPSWLDLPWWKALEPKETHVQSQKGKKRLNLQRETKKLQVK